MTDNKTIYSTIVQILEGARQADDQLLEEDRKRWRQTVDNFREYLSRTDKSLWERFVSQGTVLVIPLDDYGAMTVIAVEEGTTSIDIRNNATLALQIRDKVQEFQGYMLPGGASDILAEFNYGKSYAEIAEWLNERLKRYLTDILNALSINIDLVDSAPIRENYDQAREILMALRFNPAMIDDLLWEWLDHLNCRETFFARDMPIDRDKVISAIKYWRNKPIGTVAETGQV